MKMVEISNYETFKYKLLTNKYTQDLSEKELKKRYKEYKKKFDISHGGDNNA